MSCFYPRQAAVFDMPNGKRKTLIIPYDKQREQLEKYGEEYSRRWYTYTDESGEVVQTPVFSLPCGMCLGCRNDKAREWATRCALEACDYPSDRCFFVTLTYEDSYLPYGAYDIPSCRKQHITEFMERLRDHFQYRGYNGIRFYGATEYGEKYQRPHIHLLLFNVPLDDLDYIGNNFRGDVYYTSPVIEKEWPFGFHVVAELTLDTAAYTARYVMKKLAGPAKWQYDRLGIEAPDHVMSRRPGLGRGFAERSFQKIYTAADVPLTSGELVLDDFGNKVMGFSAPIIDRVVMKNGDSIKPPRYFDNLFANSSELNAYNLDIIKSVRADRGRAMQLAKLAQCNYSEEQLLTISAENLSNAQRLLVRALDKNL